jgi:hypothetical protein
MVLTQGPDTLQIFMKCSFSSLEEPEKILGHFRRSFWLKVGLKSHNSEFCVDLKFGGKLSQNEDIWPED